MIGSEIFELGRRAIWDRDVNALPAWKARLLRAVRIVYRVVEDIVDGDLPLRAMSLVYTTLLSFVPLLAVSFSVLKGFGVHNQIEPMLLQFVAPLGEKGAELVSNVIGFVENMRVGVLGSVGLAVLLYTVVSLIQKIETALNFTWHTTQTRSLGQRFSDYLSVIMVGPVLMFSAMGLTATIMSHSFVQSLIAIQPLGEVVRIATKLLPYVLVIAAFTFVYAFVPNTKVKVRSALVGGVVGGVAWQAWGLVFATFVAISAKYTAIYSGFAIVLFFMIWLHVSWLILLIGASIAFYHQHPEYLIAGRQEFELSARLKEKIALLLARFVARRHYEGGEPWTLATLAARLGMPMEPVGRVLESLESAKLLKRTGDVVPGYLPARALERIRVLEVLDAVRSAEEGAALAPDRLPAEASVERLLGGMNDAMRSALADRTLRELAVEDPAAAADA